jgi:hypothetical protein
MQSIKFALKNFAKLIKLMGPYTIVAPPDSVRDAPHDVAARESYLVAFSLNTMKLMLSILELHYKVNYKIDRDQEYSTEFIDSIFAIKHPWASQYDVAPLQIPFLQFSAR